MSNDYFQFKQFTIRQQRCAMKVGTDGTLLGAWAAVPQCTPSCRVLDIGTGTGLIALMIAQRFPNAAVVGIDIDAAAVLQARENVAASPFASRIVIHEADVQQFDDADGFDAIVSNPPFFLNALESPDRQRTTARHAVSLTYGGLMKAASRLLCKDGLLSVIIPTETSSQLETAARFEGFFLSRICNVRTTLSKQPRRQLIEITKHPVNKLDTSDEVIDISPNIHSHWYKQLTQEFYLK